VPQQFFPLSERPELFFQMRLPEGTAIGVTAETAAKAERSSATIPTSPPTHLCRPGLAPLLAGLNPQLPNEAFAEIVIVAKDVDARERIKARVEAAVAAGALSEARVRSTASTSARRRLSRPVPGDRPRADGGARDRGRVREAMRANPDVVDPHLDWNEMTPSVRLVVDQERARALGLDPQASPRRCSCLLSGRPVTVVRDGTERVEVVARAVPASGSTSAASATSRSFSRTGVPCPRPGRPRHLRPRGADPVAAQPRHVDHGPRGRRRQRAAAGRDGPDLAEARGDPDRPLPRLPAGDRRRGEESAKGNASLSPLSPHGARHADPLMIQLQSFSRLILVFLTAPLGIIGASLALNLSGKPFGFVALLGLIALAGMIMRNAVILVDQIETDVDGGLSLREAIVEATVRRARPVVLTALAAILAMWPLSSSAFWGPMAFTIMGGLFVATFLTLLFLPALYALWFRKRLDERGAAEDEDAVRLEPRPALPMAAE
jgi:multidrug efflux pump subunit AcrB